MPVLSNFYGIIIKMYFMQSEHTHRAFGHTGMNPGYISVMKMSHKLKTGVVILCNDYKNSIADIERLTNTILDIIASKN